jgi:exopolyphosphatase/guanosine-5'-triphosphate,3'-diphosphate pyrophosphatase
MTPRWEWRTFGARLGVEGGPFAGLRPESVQASDEVYLLSSENDECVKIRDGLLDVKHLEKVNDDGLEQWRPVSKEAFPVSTADVKAVLATLGVAPPPLARDAYTVDDFIADVVEPATTLRAVRVHKHREHFLLDGCMAELTELRFDGGETRTIAIESEDPALVTATVGKAGMGSIENVSLPRGLKTLTGFGARRYAVIDVGTNSVKFHVGELAADGGWSTVVDRSAVTRLGEGVDETGRLSAEPMKRTANAIAEMADQAKQLGALETAAVGTAGLRLASNGQELVTMVKEQSGVAIDVISGEEEARLAYLAVTAGLGSDGGTRVVFDTGGGSSQFTFAHGEVVDERFSLPVGAVRFTEALGLGGVVSDEGLSGALDAIAGDLSPLDGRPAPDALVAIGGAVTNLAAVKHSLATYDPDVVNGTVLDHGEIDRQIELYRTSTTEERRRIVGLQPGRAEVILAGACIVRTVMRKLGQSALTVSDRGLRHGLLAERFG